MSVSDVLKNIDIDLYDLAPNKVWVCRCEQCRYVKNKRKNKKLKIKVRRLLNKKRRKGLGSGVCFYWS
jgi:hypothetical protein